MCKVEKREGKTLPLGTLAHAACFMVQWDALTRCVCVVLQFLLMASDSDNFRVFARFRAITRFRAIASSHGFISCKFVFLEARFRLGLLTDDPSSTAVCSGANGRVPAHLRITDKDVRLARKRYAFLPALFKDFKASLFIPIFKVFVN